MATEIIKCPLPGKVLTVKIKKGDIIKKEDIICVIRALKMEIPILAPIDGTLNELNVVDQQIVKIGDTLAVILSGGKRIRK
jgi:glutaconyl-CoA decarboxylase